MGYRFGAAAGLAALLVCGPVHAAEKAPTVTFTKVVESLPLGMKFAVLQDFTLMGCMARETLTANGSPTPLDPRIYEPLFAQAFGLPNYVNTSGSGSLFDSTPTIADYEIGALVTAIDLKVCQVRKEDVSILLKGGSTGSAKVRVEWQVYDKAAQRVVAKIPTEAVFEVKKRAEDTLPQLMSGAFSENVKQLAASPQLTALLSAAPATTSAQTPIALKLASLPAKPVPIAEASGAVVLVRTGGGHGSGFLISSDGYLLTNAHVVGDAKTVKVRWSDGLETEGDVVRLHAQRDVALIKTDPRGRDPLPIRASSVAAGDTVLAIGAPLDIKFQGSVTRGVVSANRILDGFSFIQSDVSVNPGNSGGPLVDDKGAVAGITVSGRVTEGVPVGVNFFIPIRDALAFLKLDAK